ncbi:MAG: single-stranded-DNA-specific exonuclease RecJ, partial [Planctomycetes bacterium]|nr:single-stranded-DNA-specific exonuclease RecJ [Planctomycetota bacterium]
KHAMLQYGGHAQAAGLEIRAADVEALRDAVNARARETYPDGLPAQPLAIDADVPFETMTPELMRQIEKLEPYGERNAKPVLLSRDIRLCEPPRVVGNDRSHLILRFRRGGHELRAIAFGLASRERELVMGHPVHLVYTPGWNTFRGETSLQLVVTDFRCGMPAPV